MAYNYSANQFEHEFKPTSLCNWQVPSKWPSKRSYHHQHRYQQLQQPHQNQPHKNVTKIIANDRGHLLPGVVRPTSNPWGNFRGTWQLPDKITRAQAKEISSVPSPFSAPNYNNRWTSKSAKPKNYRRKETIEKESCLDFVENGIDNRGDKLEKNLEYAPGDLTSPKQQHTSREILLQQKKDRLDGKEFITGEPNDLYLEKHDCTDKVSLLNEEEKKRREKIPHVLGEDVQDNFEAMKQHIPDKPTEQMVPPLVPAYCNFQVARKMAQENLEHQPLPDAVMDRAYRKLQAAGDAFPGLALECLPSSTGVGVKSYKAGPTQCTKLRVYRPKTCGVVPKMLDKSKLTERPHTSGTKKEKMGPMDLAICWDYRPMNPLDEPKPPVHIDGSNGSAAPAVFNLVKTPRSATTPLETGRSGGVFSHTLGDENFFNKDVLQRQTDFNRKPPISRTCNCGNSPDSWKKQNNKSADYRPRSVTRNDVWANKQQKQYKSSPNLSVIAHASDESIKDTDAQCELVCIKHKPIILTTSKPHHRHHHHHHHRRKSQDPEQQNKTTLKTPRLCQQKTDVKTESPKPEYKKAFKAGIPNSNSSGTCTSFDSGCSSMTSSSSSSNKPLKVPKPRDPYAKKNYNIDTLAPPFACWRGQGSSGYPEHWRLVSVYQQAYKPVEQRKRPLLATVYQ